MAYTLVPLYKLLFFKEYWRRSFDFSGKTSRRVFWLTLFQTFIIYLFILAIPIFIYVLQATNTQDYITRAQNLSWISWIVAIINFIPQLSLQIRRLNDIEKEPAWVLLNLIPFVSLVLIFWYAKPSIKNRLNCKSTFKAASEKNTKTDKNIKRRNVIEELERLSVMKEKGLLTEDEFSLAKAKLLN